MARESWAWKQRDYLRADGEVMTPTEIKQKWERNCLIQRSRGTLFHYHCEIILNGAVVEGPPSPEFGQWLQIFENVITTTSTIYRTELSLVHFGLRVAGQIDCLCRAPDGSLHIWDWKRSKR